MPQGGHQGKFPSSEEVDKGAAPRTDVIDLVLEAEPFDRRDRMASTNHGQSVGLRDRDEEFSRADRKRLEFEDARGTVEENRLGPTDHIDIVCDGVEADVVNREFRGE